MKELADIDSHSRDFRSLTATWRAGMMGCMQQSLHVTADSRDSNWSFGTFSWVLLASLRSRCSSAAPEFPELLKCRVMCTRCQLSRMTLHDAIDSLHALSMHWKVLNSEFDCGILQRAVLALEYRVSDILATSTLAANVIQQIANFFVFFMRFFQYRRLFAVMPTPKAEGSDLYDAMCEKYIGARRFRKKLLGTYFILSPRISDLAGAFEDYSAETILQSGRSEKWNQVAQTRAYNDTLKELLLHDGFRDAVRLNAFDLWFKHTFNIAFKDHFLILQKDVMHNYNKLSSTALPLIVYAHDGISVLYNGKLSKSVDCVHAFQIWFAIIDRDHDGAVFKNILVQKPS